MIRKIVRFLIFQNVYLNPTKTLKIQVENYVNHEP